MTGVKRKGTDPAVLWSLAGHGLLLLLVLIGGISLPHKSPPSQLAIQATVVETPGKQPPRARPAPQPAPAPVPEPVPVPVPEPEPKPPPPRPEPAPDPRKAEQEKLAQQKLAREKLEKEKLQKEKLQQEKAAAERAKAEAAKEKAAKEKAAREKAEAEKREQAAREAAARDLDRQLEEEERLLAATDSGALADYVAVIRQKVERNWVRPPGAKPGIECEVLVTQIPGGQVTAVQVGRCNADDAVRRSIEAAVLRASPLPPPADATLFERNLRFSFKPEQ